MDPVLIDYLRSGKAWMLLGTGPSIAMGYPSWGALAAAAVSLCRTEGDPKHIQRLETLLKQADYPGVFDQASAILGMPRLLAHLLLHLRPSQEGRIYELVAGWPVPVYLTTNFDHEISTHLSKLGATYRDYNNTEEHLGHLLPDTDGAVVYLHGDLRSEQGLVLTSGQYQEIAAGDTWAGWRTKLTSILQMNRVIILGHSLTDPHVRHILAAAKRGSSVAQPVCWIAPDVAPDQARRYLEEYRIRVITYDNSDKGHRNLVRLIEQIDDFVPPRTAVRISSRIASMSQSALGENAAATGFFVFNKLSASEDFESKRVDVLLAALRASLLHLEDAATFSLEDALRLSGWPESLSLAEDLRKNVEARAVDGGVLVRRGTSFGVGAGAAVAVRQDKAAFEHIRGRFIESLERRVRRDFPGVQDPTEIARDVEGSLTGYFREGGLSLASTLSLGGLRNGTTVPPSILRFITLASAKYDDHLRRQAFTTVSLDAFVRAQPVEREYLGRISQGFFAFHCLGVFGDAALERLRHLRDTVWLLDSSVQIPAIALAAPANAAFSGALAKLRRLEVRLFSIQRLFDETREHLWFADRVVHEHGPTSPNIIAAANGSAPFRKANLFLQGFVEWQGAGNPADWDRYLYALSGKSGSVEDVAKAAVRAAGVEVLAFSDWPGFAQVDFEEAESLTQTIAARYSRSSNSPVDKARPEAEALLVVEKERAGIYGALKNSESPAWFISETSILNAVHKEAQRITWQPEAFLRFVGTLSAAPAKAEAEEAFDTLLWALAQSGVNVLDDGTVERVFGGVIDQARLTIEEQHEAYEAVLGTKYGEPIDVVLRRVAPSQRPLAALQLAHERAAKELELRTVAEAAVRDAKRSLSAAQRQLAELEQFRRKREAKQRKAVRGKRRADSSRGRKRR